MPKPPDEFVKVRRRSRTGGANVFINADVICKALKNANMDCSATNLKAKASACKDGKRAKIIIQIV